MSSLVRMSPLNMTGWMHSLANMENFLCRLFHGIVVSLILCVPLFYIEGQH